MSINACFSVKGNEFWACFLEGDTDTKEVCAVKPPKIIQPVKVMWRNANFSHVIFTARYVVNGFLIRVCSCDLTWQDHQELHNSRCCWKLLAEACGSDLSLGSFRGCTGLSLELASAQLGPDPSLPCASQLLYFFCGLWIRPCATSWARSICAFCLANCWDSCWSVQHQC